MGTMASWWLAVLAVVAVQCLSAHECPSSCLCFLTDDGEDAANCTDLAAISDFSASLQVLYVLSPPETPTQAVDLPADTFQALHHLKYLHLNNASLEQLQPETFRDLKDLLYLDVSYNFLSHVGQLADIVQQMPHLRELNARGNPFLTLPPTTTLFNSQSLQYLDLGFCGFESIPDVSFKNLSSLDHLNLDGNSLKYVSFASFPKHIRYINLSNNQLEALDIYGLPELEHLHEVELTGSSLHCTCDLLGVRDMLVDQGLVSENPVICAEPSEYEGKPWLEVKKETVCQSEAHHSEHRDSGEHRARALDSHEMMQGDQPMEAEVSSASQEDADDYEDDKDDGDDSEGDGASTAVDSELIPHEHSNRGLKLMPFLNDDDDNSDDKNNSETEYSDYSDVDAASYESTSNDEGSGEPSPLTDDIEGTHIMRGELFNSVKDNGDEDNDDYDYDDSSSNDESALPAGDEDGKDDPEESNVATIDKDNDETEHSSMVPGNDDTDDSDNRESEYSDEDVDDNEESEDISTSITNNATDTNERSGELEDSSISATDYDNEGKDSDIAASSDEDKKDQSTSSNSNTGDANFESKETDAINATDESTDKSLYEDDDKSSNDEKDDTDGTTVVTDVVEVTDHEKEEADIINLLNTEDDKGKNESEEASPLLIENGDYEASFSEEDDHSHSLTTESNIDDNEELKNVFLVAHTIEDSNDDVTEESNRAINENDEVSENSRDSEEASVVETSTELTTENSSGNNSNDDADDYYDEGDDTDDDEEEFNKSGLGVGSLLHSNESESHSTGVQSDSKDDEIGSIDEVNPSTEKTEVPYDERTSAEENTSIEDESESEQDEIPMIHHENEPIEYSESDSEEENTSENDESKPEDYYSTENSKYVGIEKTGEEIEPTNVKSVTTDETTDATTDATYMTTVSHSHYDEYNFADRIPEDEYNYVEPTSENPPEVHEEHIKSKVSIDSEYAPIGQERGLGAISDVATTHDYITLYPTDEMTTTEYESTEAVVVKIGNRNIIIPPNHEDATRKSGNTKVSINEIGVSGSSDQVSFSEEKPAENSTASFVVLGCIMAAIVALLGYAVVRSRMQKATERRRNVEKKDPNMRELKELTLLLKPDSKSNGDSSQRVAELTDLLSPESDQVIPNGVTSNGSAKLNHDTPGKTAVPQKPPRNVDPNRSTNLTDVIVEQVPESLRDSDVELRRPPGDTVGNGVNKVEPNKSKVYQPVEERLSSTPIRARLSDIPSPLKQKPVFITNPGPKTTKELL